MHKTKNTVKLIDAIRVRGARQNNLKNLDVDFPIGEFIVVTGVSGSGKSSLAFDTVYAEGQRRYIETFSSYARMFLERMDPPEVDSVDGIPPAIAIRQINPVRTSRSTVGTMTEINDRLKLLFAKRARLFCPKCGKEVIADSVETVVDKLKDSGCEGKRISISFKVDIPPSFTLEETVELLGQQGYRRIKEEGDGLLKVAQDMVVFEAGKRARIGEAIETAFAKGKGEISVCPLGDDMTELAEYKFSNRMDCPDCGIEFQMPTPNMFSFNSPVGACETCRGFGRTISISKKLIVPDPSKSVAEGCIRPFQTNMMLVCQRELMRHAKKRKFPVNTPWNQLSEEDRRWVFEGEGDFDSGLWWGVDRFFADIEARSYKMHARIMLAHYREYVECHMCHGSRLKAAAMNWKLVLGQKSYNIQDIMLMPISDVLAFFCEFRKTLDSRDAQTLFDEIIPTLTYLCEVGLGYLTLDRQSRTLSGGEVQRINLTQALGSSLVNTLFVLDEPSIGLHPRDIERLIAVLRRLRDAGNTVLVVEHDPEVIKAADRVIEMGPGPGERGGSIIFNGSVPALLQSASSVSAPYLRGDRDPESASEPEEPLATLKLRVRGAREHNLKNISVEFPLNQYVVVTGVSGSGKSTLVNDVLYSNVMRSLGKVVESSGECDGVDGTEYISEAVMVDQSPIGKTTRSTPGSYVKAFDAIRKLFAKLPAAIERGYSYGDFSFNSGVGRCPHCEGSGFEMVEMQFLSDVYLKCEECGGRRYRKEILEVKMNLPGRGRAISIADALELTVDEAADIFAADKNVVACLRPLQDVGLGYLRLGQPVPTLSGGEAQRLKLAGHLAEDPKKKTRSRRNTLFIFDEPTTGLHFTDTELLNGVLRRLVEAGNSVVVIEHNIMVMRAADHIIDLGPEGGEAGGEVVAVGTPAEIEMHSASATGAALRADTRDSHARRASNAEPTLLAAETASAYSARKRPQMISVRKAHEHNLRNIDVDIPLDKFSVITGVSGSGKSTLAFDILFASGQRRYLECLNAYARQFVQPQAKPDVLSLSALPPTVAIEQRLSQGGWKSTVATVTELYNALRLLFLTLGVQHCPDCGGEISRQTPERIMERMLGRHAGKDIMLLARLVSGRKGVYKDLAEWAAKRGCKSLRVDGEWRDTKPWEALDRYKEHNIDYPVATIRPTEAGAKELLAKIKTALDHGNGLLRVLPLGGKKKEQEYVVSTARVCTTCGTSFEEPDPRLFSFNSHRGYCHECDGYGVVAGRGKAAKKREKDEWQSGRTRSFADVVGDDIDGAGSAVCSACGGSRLNPVARAFRFRGKGIQEFTSMTISYALAHFRKIKLTARERAIASPIIEDIISRLTFLEKVGLGYLTLDRAVPTLSGGESQRIRLSSQLGSNLCGVCYILDEPTIGLHHRDTQMLLDTIEGLRDKGNTVLVVEHDEMTMRRADYIVDLGPGAGVEGGEVVATGSIKQILKSERSKTSQFLKSPMKHPLNGSYRDSKNTAFLTVKDARMHNLRGIDVEIPLERLTVVTGVSGSGKSTLVRDVLHESMRPINKPRGKVQPVGCAGIDGAGSIKRVLEVDQTPIGRTPRSCPATYVGFWTQIRQLFASTPDAKLWGYNASRFSFNIEGGRCHECLGQGAVRIEMAFLPEVVTLCETCGGARFNPDTLYVKYNGKTIADVLSMSVSEALGFFEPFPSIHYPLQLLSDVGMGYISLGQQSATLSGGEAQRIKLVTELARCTPRPGFKAPATLYVLDEPTVGLHMADVANLLKVVHRLVDGGHTVVMIEHNPDVIAEADWIIDLGPEGGDGGGSVVAAGSPADLAKKHSPKSHTAKFLAEMLG